MGQTKELAEVLKRQEEELERTKQRLGQNIKARREALGQSGKAGLSVGHGRCPFGKHRKGKR